MGSPLRHLAGIRSSQWRYSTSQCIKQAQRKPPQLSIAPRRYFSGTSSRCQRYQWEFGQKADGLTRFQKLRATARDSPVLFTLASLCILAGLGAVIYANYYYLTYIVGAFHKYPESVAKPLRKALYYDRQAPDPKKALHYYQEALKEAANVGMDPWSDEIVGLKIRVAAFLEQHGALGLSAAILDRLRKDASAWVEQKGDGHFEDGRRTALLAKTVQIGVKLGELYSSPQLADAEAAEANLVSAVETVLREKQRREKEGVKEGEGEWINADETGASFEALAEHYERANKHYLATPLYLQALTLCPPKSCHSVTLMNNLATSLAQQRPPPSMAERGEQLPTPDALRQQATLWAQKALQLARAIQPPDRTEECDVACAVATHNLGEFAEMAGDFEEAERKYREAAKLAEAVGFVDGMDQAKEGLTRLQRSKSWDRGSGKT